MCEFHYGYIKNKYCKKLIILFTDPDSLMFEIKSEDASEDFSSGTEMFNFSN